MVDAAARVAADGDQDLAVNLLWRAAQRCFWGDPGQEARNRVLAAAEGMHVDDGDPRLLAILAYVAPVERGRVIIDRLSRLASDGGGDAQASGLLGTAAMVVGAFDLGAGFLAVASAGLRAQGRLVHLARLLTLQAWAAVYLADWKVAMPAAGRLSHRGPGSCWPSRNWRGAWPHLASGATTTPTSTWDACSTRPMPLPSQSWLIVKASGPLPSPLAGGTEGYGPEVAEGRPQGRWSVMPSGSG
jgi:hypothetical protein